MSCPIKTFEQLLLWFGQGPNIKYQKSNTFGQLWFGHGQQLWLRPCPGFVLKQSYDDDDSDGDDHDYDDGGNDRDDDDGGNDGDDDDDDDGDDDYEGDDYDDGFPGSLDLVANLSII